MTLPPLLRDWPADAREEHEERAAIIHAGQHGTEAEWPLALEAAEGIVRRRWQAKPAPRPEAIGGRAAPGWRGG